MFLAHIAHDRIVKLIARNLDGIGKHRTAEGDQRHVSRAAADVHDHVAARLRNVDPGTDCSRNGLLDEIGVARAGFLRCVNHRALFNLCHAGRHTHHNARFEKNTCANNLFQEIMEQALRDVII